MKQRAAGVPFEEPAHGLANSLDLGSSAGASAQKVPGVRSTGRHHCSWVELLSPLSYAPNLNSPLSWLTLFPSALVTP